MVVTNMYIYYVVAVGYKQSQSNYYGIQLELDHEIRIMDDVMYLNHIFYKQLGIENTTILSWQLLQNENN